MRLLSPHLLPGLLAALLTAAPALAQNDPGNGGPEPAVTAVPLDGGAALLLAGGAAYAVRRLRRSSRS